MANRRYIDFPIASTSGDTDIILIWQGGANKQTTKATFLSGLPENLDELNDVAISGLTNGQILRYDSVTGKWENTDQGNLDLNDLNDVSIVSPSNGQVLVYNSSTSRWENSSAGFVPYTGAVTTVNLGAQTIQAGSFVKAGGTAAQFLKANGSVDSTAYGTGTVTSVALTMPTAFTVGGSPITTAGTLAVTGAGTVGQYIRGDGSLADFPESSGGGSSVSYYLNGSVNQGTIGGVAYKELNKVPILGAGTDFTINADGYIASFITDAGDPNLLEIPAGNWTFETYFSASSGGGSPSFYVELYKVNSGGTATLIASNSTFPELIAFGTNIISYFSTLAVPTTALALTDRLAIRYYVTHSGRTITLHTEDNHLCQIITTFTTGLTALNGLTAQIQNFAVGTSGTDFAISSATATHTFNLPTASATNRGALSSADWTTFNNKTSNLGTVTSVGLSSATSGVTIGSTPVTGSGTITLAIATASGSQNGLLSSTDWTTFNSKQNLLTNPVTGTGTTNTIPKFTGSTTIGNSELFETSNKIGYNTSTPVGGGGAGDRTFSINANSGSAAFITNMIGGTRYATLFTSSSNFILETNASIPIIFSTNEVEAMRIFSGRNVHIGPTPASDNGARLQVTGAATISSTLTANGNIFLANDGTYGSSYITLGFGGTSNGSNRIFAGTSSNVDGIIIAAATGRPISFRAGGGTTDHLTIATTGAATFSTSASVAGLNLGSTYASKLGVYNPSSAANMELGMGTNTNGTIVSRATFYNINNGNTGNESSANFIGVSSIETQLVTANGNASGTSGGSIIFKTKRDGGTLDNTLILASTGAATFSGDVTISKTSPTFRLTRGTTSASSLLVYNTNGTDDWLVGTGVTGSNTNYRVYNNGLGADAIFVVNSNNNVLIGTTTDAGARLQVNGDITTSAPAGGTAGKWKLGTFTSGAVAIGGRIRIEINGVAYDILTT